MSGDHSQQLAQLADIHVSGAPAWWPPAPGWWILAIVLMLIIYRLVRRVMKKLAVRKRQKAWLQELESIECQYDPIASPGDYLAAMNRLFRAVALRAFPDTACARLQGEAWVAFLAGLMPDSAPGNLAVLAAGPYQPVPEFDAGALSELAAEWVRRYG